MRSQSPRRKTSPPLHDGRRRDLPDRPLDLCLFTRRLKDRIAPAIVRPPDTLRIHQRESGRLQIVVSGSAEPFENRTALSISHRIAERESLQERPHRLAGILRERRTQDLQTIAHVLLNRGEQHARVLARSAGGVEKVQRHDLAGISGGRKLLASHRRKLERSRRSLLRRQRKGRNRQQEVASLHL